MYGVIINIWWKNTIEVLLFIKYKKTVYILIKTAKIILHSLTYLGYGCEADINININIPGVHTF